MARRRICFVTGTRAEFGLMRTTLRAIAAHPQLDLQLVVTGMHLDRAHGRSIDSIRREGWTIDAAVPWPRAEGSASSIAQRSGNAMARLATVYEKLKSDVVLVVGDRVEAFAAAAAAHLSQRPLAHVHGGDRAAGQIDDSLRHAISKLAHIHFPATAGSAKRLLRLGEDRWRIHLVGSPGNDGIREAAWDWPRIAGALPALQPRRFALLALHPENSDESIAQRHAEMVASALRRTGFGRTVIIHPNNDPGHAGIVRQWHVLEGDDHFLIRRDIPRGMFLGLMRDAAVLVGNSSAGIIEAASFGTPVLNLGQRQSGRERSGNVRDVAFSATAIRRALAVIWREGHPLRSRARNVYGAGGAGEKIARHLATVPLDARLLRKLITY